MKTRRILLVDQDANNIRILKESFAQANYALDHAASDLEAINLIEKQEYDLVLSEISLPSIDGFRLLENLQRNPKTSSLAVVFLTKKSDIYNRVRSFRLGAKDFIVKPIHVQEIIARVGMVLSRIEKREEDEAIEKRKFLGRLEDLRLADLIESFGIERKTGVLTLNNQNGLGGQLFFRNGAVINANTNGLNAEEAVYKMMGWTKGRFSMLFKNVDAPDEISISNLGLLIQGTKIMQKREALLNTLPSLNSVLVTTNNFKEIIGPQKLTPDVEYFLSLFDGERTLARIIDESVYDDLTTLERIQKLYRLGFLRALRDKGMERDSMELKETLVEESLPVDSKELIADEQLSPDAEPESVEESYSESKEEMSELESTEDFYPDVPKWAISKFTSREEVVGEQPMATTSEEIGTVVRGVDSERTYVTAVATDNEAEDLGPEPDQEDETGLFSDFESGEEKSIGEISFEKGKSEIKELSQKSDERSQDTPELERSISEVADEDSKVEKLSAPNIIRSDRDVNETHMTEVLAEEVGRSSPPMDKKVKADLHLAKAHVLIFGSDSLGRKELIDNLIADQGTVISPSNGECSDIYCGVVEFRGGHNLNVLGISTDKEFTPLVDYLAPRTIGYILLVDINKERTWKYLGYLIHTLDYKLPVPSMLAAFSPELEAKSLITKLQSHLALSSTKRLYVLNSLDLVNLKRMIFALFGLSQKIPNAMHLVQGSNQKKPVMA